MLTRDRSISRIICPKPQLVRSSVVLWPIRCRSRVNLRRNCKIITTASVSIMLTGPGSRIIALLGKLFAFLAHIMNIVPSTMYFLQRAFSDSLTGTRRNSAHRTVLFPDRYVLSNIGRRHLSLSILPQCLPFALHSITTPASFIISNSLSTPQSLITSCVSPSTTSHHFLLASLHLASQSWQIASISLGLDSRPSDTRSKL